MNNKHITITLLRYTLQWYSQVMRETLLRYKILVVFLLALLAPKITSLQTIIMAPANELVSQPDSNYGLYISTLLGTQIFSLTWVMLHKSVIANRSWDKYLHSLPISAKKRKLVEFISLAIFDAIIWAPLVCAIFINAHKSNCVNNLLLLGKSFSVIGLTFLLQFVYLKKKYIYLPLIFCIDTLIVFMPLLTTINLQLILYFSSIVSLVASIICCENKMYQNDIRYRTKLFNNSPSLFTILLQSLFENKSQISMLLFMAATSLIFASILASHASSIPNIPVIISILMLVNALAISNIYKRIHMNWNVYRNYTNSLPVKNITLIYSCLLIAMLMFFIFNLPLLSIIIFMANATIFVKSCAGFTIALIYLMTTYYPQISGGRYGLFASFLMMCLFGYIDHALIK